jgi:pimeloyl-ACP methyl ester carboxylesterase
METRHSLTAPGGATIAYRRWRCASPVGGAPLVLVHGAASNLTRWSEFVEETTIKTGRDIVRLDMRGHGESLWRGPTSLEIWCDDIAAILGEEEITRAVLAGHCLGANVAVMFAARHPARSAGLVLVEPMLHEALSGRLGALRRLAPLLRVATGGIRLLNRLGLHRRRLEALDLQALDREFRVRLAEPHGSEALAERYASTLHDLRIMPTAGSLQDLVEVVRPLPLARIGVPLLALLASGQMYADNERTRLALERTPHHELRTLVCQHWIPTEQPAAMREAIEDWFARTAL